MTSTGSASSAASNDYATTPNSFSLIVKVTDLASNTATGTITINVTEVDNTAPVLADQTFTYAESQAANYAIGTVSATDSNTLTYAFETGENSDGFFAINSSSGAITLTSTGSTSSAASNDYETIPNSFSLIVKVTDPSSNTTTGTITINVTDVSEIIDDDQDGLPNGEELELGTDPFDADTDGDGVLDGTEVTDGTNPLDVCDYVSAHITQVQKEAWLNADCDSDGLTNKEEKDLGTDPKNADTDGDGVLDGTEVTDGTDPLNLCDFVLIHQTLTPSQEWSEADCDKDGLTNEKEKELGTDPKNPDTDGDGVLDSTEVIDGTDPLDLCDFILSHQTLTPSDDWNTVDCDEDGLTNEKEKELGADPRNPDTDGDGVVDGTEVTDTTNLFDHCDFILTSQTVATKSEWNNADCDNDGATNGEEMEYGSNPLDKDSDKDGVLDGTELTDVTDALDGCSLILEHQTILANINMWNMLDCDNDSIPNGEEIKEDTDNDGLFNFLDSDDDNDGIPTIEEFPNANKNAFGDIAMDANNNNIPDYLETNNFNPNEEDGIEVYNALTPNGDGVHDIFTIRNISIYPDNELRVYNRWGKLVYEMKGYGSNGRYFSGTSNLGAQRLSSGTYFYVLNYKDANAQNKTREGYLYLNR